MNWLYIGKLLPVLLVFCLFSALFGAARADDDAPRAVLIMDGSGSMWGQIGGQSKTLIARDALSDVLSAPDLKLSMGLVAFGHRRKGACDDVEVMRGLAPLKAAEFLATVGKISPRGKTPMAKALEAAAGALEYKKEKGAIILLTDGFDNCRQDPCKAARRLKSEGAGLAVHVIGFGDSAKELKQVRCVAEQGGGLYLPAKDGAALKSALAKVIAAVGAPASPAEPAKAELPAPPKAPAQKPAGPGLKLTAVLTEGGEALQEGVSWRVYAGAGGVAAPQEPVGESDLAAPQLPLAQGRYRVTATYGEVMREEDVDVTSDGVTAATLVLNAGTVRLTAAEASGGAALTGVAFELFEEASGSGTIPYAARRGSEARFTLGAGTYLIKARRGLAEVEQPLTVAAGEHKDLTLVLNIGRLNLSALETANGPAIRDLFFTVYEADADGPGEGLGRELIRTAAGEPHLQLPAGGYIVVAEHGLARVAERVTVFPGRSTDKVINLNAGQLKLSSRIAGSSTGVRDNVSYRIFALENGKEREITRTSRPSATLKLGGGTYKIAGRLGNLNAAAEQTIEIEPGGVSDVTLDYQAGSVTLALVARPGAPAYPNVFWQLLDSEDREIWRTSRSTPNFTLAAGSYKAIAQKSGEKYTQSFSVASGDKKKLEIVAE